MIFVMFWDLFNFNRLNQSYKQIVVQNYSSIVASENMLGALDKHLNALILLRNKDELSGSKKMFEDAKEDFFFWLDKAQQSAYTTEEKSILDSLNAEYRVLLVKVNNLTSQISDNRYADTDTSYYAVMSTISKVKNICFGLFEINHKFIEGSENQIRNITVTAAFTMIFLALVGIILSLIFSSKFSNYIVKPVQELTKSIQHVSAGNLSQTIESSEQDEIGQLAEEFNDMIVRLQKYEELNISKLLSEKKKSETVIESINDPVVMIDENYNILLANKAFSSVFGAANSRIFENIIKDNKVVNNISSLLLGKDDSINEDTYVYKNGNDSEKYFDLKYNLINLPENNKNAVLIFFTDITKYEELDRMKSEFVAKVSHELKTPLTSIGMAVGILDDEVVGNLGPKQKELLKSIRQDYNRLYSLVKEILELSKIDSESFRLNLTRIELTDFLESCLNKYYFQCENKGINLSLKSYGSKLYILGDAEYLSSAIGNFIDNSIKFTNPGGKIEIGLEQINDNIKIEISDNGQGIDPIYLDKIFDKFVQISDRRPGSVGLGLSIAKEIIEMHHGNINVWSKKGIGSKFEIILPEYKHEQG